MIDPRFTDLLKKHATQLRPDEELEMDRPLADYGINSLGIIQLLVQMEDTFGITVPDEYLSGRSLRTGRTVWEVVSALRKPPGPGQGS